MTLEYELLLSMAFSCFLHEKEVGGEGKRERQWAPQTHLERIQSLEYLERTKQLRGEKKRRESPAAGRCIPVSRDHERGGG